MSKQKIPDHCKGCPHHHVAGHKKGSKLENSKHNNWCCHYSNHAPKVVSICIQQGFREEKL